MNKEFRYTKIHLAKSPETVVLNLFCLIYALAKSKNFFHLQQCLVCQVMIFLERVRGNFYRKNVVNMHSEQGRGNRPPHPPAGGGPSHV